MKWIRKYFRGRIAWRFLRYYQIHRTTCYFVDHTGCDVEERTLRMLKKRYAVLVEAMRRAKADFDIETVLRLESGEYDCA